VVLPAAIILSAVCAEAAPDSGVQPDADFLEFLGSWSIGEARPQWIDPFQIQDFPIESPSDPGQRPRQELKDRLKRRQTDSQSPAPPPSPDSDRAREGVKP